MRFTIGLKNGNWYRSDEIANEELISQMEAEDGLVGIGKYETTKINTLEEYVHVMLKAAVNDVGNDFTVKSFLITMDGKPRMFAVSEIAWVEAEGYE